MSVGFYTTVVREVGYRAVGRPGEAKPPYQIGYLLGPFESEEIARAHILQAKREAEAIDPFCAFDAFGTCSITTDGPLPAGALNERCGI